MSRVGKIIRNMKTSGPRSGWVHGQGDDPNAKEVLYIQYADRNGCAYVSANGSWVSGYMPDHFGFRPWWFDRLRLRWACKAWDARRKDEEYDYD